MKTAFRLVLVFILFYANPWTANASPLWYSKNTDNQIVIHVEMFLSSTCPHCQAADAFFRDVEAKSSDLSVQRNFINKDKDALVRFNQLLNEQQMEDFSVPSIYICNSRWVGFASAETTGKDLLNAINYCKQQIEKNGDLTQTTVTTLRHWSNANRFDTELAKKPSNINDIILIALMDSISPCAFFCFAGFLAFLLIEKQRKRQIIASLLFISSVALVHYFQQVQTNIFFELLLWLRIPAALVGLFTIYFVMFYYKKQTTGRFYFLLAFLLGLFTTTYQQTCVMNWAAVFEQWLNNQQIPDWQLNLYQLLYQSIYILPLLLFLIVFLFLFKMKRFTAMQARLSSIGILFLIAIALILIINPFVLSYFATSLFTLIILLICAYFLNLT